MTLASGQRGLGLISAIVVLVVLAGLGAAIASLTQMANRNQSLDILGSRAAMAARAGVAWQSWLILSPEDTHPIGTRYECPVNPIKQTVNGLGFSGLDDFTVTVTCTRGTPTEDGNAIWLYSVVSVACNRPFNSACPNNNAPTGAYVERSATVLIETCRQSNGALCQ